MRFHKRSRSPRKNKNSEVQDHFRIRLYQRYGIILTKEEYDTLLKSVQRQDACLVEVQSLTRKIYKVIIQDKEVLVVYNPKRKLFHTALYPDFTPNYFFKKNNNLTSLSGIEYKNN